ncbi:MAG: hypothetical protein Cons2KO_00190 [Congregibacter sp.]
MKPFMRIDLLNVWDQAVETDGFTPDTHLIDALRSIEECTELDGVFNVTDKKVVALFASHVVNLEVGLPFIGEKLLATSARDFVAHGYGNADDYHYEVESSGFAMALFAVAHSLEPTIKSRGVLDGVVLENGKVVLERAMRLLANDEPSFDLLIKSALTPKHMVWEIFKGGLVAEKLALSAPEHLGFLVAQKRLQGEL